MIIDKLESTNNLEELNSNTEINNNSNDFCVICYEKEIITYDTSMNHNYSNKLVDFKHCLNIKVHPQCICMWFIKSKDNCVVCREKLNIDHYILNDHDTFIINAKNNDYTNFDITYPSKYIKIHDNEDNFQLNQLILNDVSNLDIQNIRSYIEAAELINNINNIGGNRIVRVTFVNKLTFSIKTVIIMFSAYYAGLLLNQIYHFFKSTISDIF